MLTVLLALAGEPAISAELKVLTAGAFRPIVAPLAIEFTARTGDPVVLGHDTVGALARRVDGGERFDVVILTRAAINALVAQEQWLRTAISPKWGSAWRSRRVPRPRPSPVWRPSNRRCSPRRRLLDIDPAAGGSSGI